MKKITLLTGAFILLSAGLFAQNQSWAVTSESNGNADDAHTIDMDNAGNRYVAGVYSGTLEIDGIDYPNYVNDGSTDGFIAKYNSNGELQWVKTINGVSNQEIRCLKVNRITGECYVSGIFYYDFFIDGIQQNTNTYLGFPGSFYRSFIVKLNTNGDLQWSNDTYSIAGYSIEGAYSIALAPDGNSVYFHVGYLGDVQFEDGIQYLPFGFGIEGMMLVRFDAATGGIMTVKNDIEKYLFYGILLTTDASGNVYYAGNHSRACMEEIDPVFAPCLTNPSSLTQGFVWKMDANFGSIWGKEISGEGFENVDGIATDNSNNVYFYGTFSSATSFDAIVINPVAGKNNAFVAKLNAAGNYSYVKQLSADFLTTTKYPADMEAPFAVDKKGNAYIGGAFTGTLNMQSYSLTTDVFPSPYYSNGFIIKLNNKGKYRWGQKYVGNTGPFDATSLRSIAVNNNLISVAGHMVDYNTYLGDTIVSDHDAFFASAIQDCDVTIQITATATSVNAANPVTLSTPLKPGYAYQWQRNNTNIPGATSNTYITTLQGNYTCIVTTGVCAITSNKIKLTLMPRLGETEITSAEIFPNPASDHLTITLSNLNADENVTVSIIDIAGKMIYKISNVVLEEGANAFSINQQIATGTYLIHITGKEINITLPVIFE